MPDGLLWGNFSDDCLAAFGLPAQCPVKRSTPVFLQSCRPGGLDTLGYGPHALAQRQAGLVYVSLSAYGSEGPWRSRRGFDSLVQTVMGFNHAEATTAATPEPKALPMQILDYATGHLMAFAASAAPLWFSS